MRGAAEARSTGSDLKRETFSTFGRFSFRAVDAFEAYADRAEFALQLINALGELFHKL